jgi:alpha-L-fucosidase
MVSKCPLRNVCPLGAGFNTNAVYDLPLEVCMTINDNWGYHTGDANHKSSRRLAHVLARSAAVGANFLLNVGPTPEGEILPVHVERLREVGQWLKTNGEAIHNTRAGMIPPTAEVVSTRRGDTHYLHVLEYPSDCVTVSGVPDTISQARLLSDGTVIPIERRGGRVILTIPPERRDTMDTVIELF